MKTVFLGGTCNESRWRDVLIRQLAINYFNPVVADWTPDCQDEEKYQREHCDYVLYVITTAMLGVYSVAEAVDDSNKRPEKTIFCFLPKFEVCRWGTAQIKSMQAVATMVENNGAKVCDSLEAVAQYLNVKQSGP